MENVGISVTVSFYSEQESGLEVGLKEFRYFLKSLGHRQSESLEAVDKSQQLFRPKENILTAQVKYNLFQAKILAD